MKKIKQSKLQPWKPLPKPFKDLLEKAINKDNKK